MRRSILACGLLLALAGIPSVVVATARGGTASEAAGQVSTQTETHGIRYWAREARRAEAATARWLTIVRGHPPRQSLHIRPNSSLQEVRDLALTWHRRWMAASRHAHHPPQLRAWYCIHRYEGSWTDPNAPYWGGLQMDYDFQNAYGAWFLKHKGTANHWAPLAQIWAGVRAWRTRGFEPWANTAHLCGVY